MCMNLFFRWRRKGQLQYILRLVAVPVLMLPVFIIVIAIIRLTTRAEHPLVTQEDPGEYVSYKISYKFLKRERVCVCERVLVFISCGASLRP